MTFGTYYHQTSFMYSVDHTMVSSSFCTSLNLSLYSIFQIHVEIFILSKDLTFIVFLASGDLNITFATILDQDP